MITIVVLIILTGVLINISLGNNGLFNKAKTAKEMYTNAQAQEELDIAKMTNQVDSWTRAGTGGGSNSVFSETLIFSASSLGKVGADGPIGTQYTLSESYKNFKYILVEAEMLANNTGTWCGTATNLIRTTNIVQTDKFKDSSKSASQKTHETWSVSCTNNCYASFYFDSDTTFCVGESTACITNIYGINF